MVKKLTFATFQTFAGAKVQLLFELTKFNYMLYNIKRIFVHFRAKKAAGFPAAKDQTHSAIPSFITFL